MVEIADLRDCAPSGLFYGGRAGQKEGILIEGEPWIAKYPRTTRDLAGKHLPSYTSSPVSEYLGSHIYELLGIPVHETMLGYRAGKIVCACRDFTFPNARLFEFKEIKNALSDDEAYGVVLLSESMREEHKRLLRNVSKRAFFRFCRPKGADAVSGEAPSFSGFFVSY